MSKPRTTTTYDTLGRVTTVTGPDGTTTTHGYYIDTSSSQGFVPTYQLNHTVADANSHAKQYVQNAYGQLAIVREMTGTVARTLYAETKYTYDVLGNLTQVRDAVGNTSVMTYNTLSQKTGMLDPDMGAWDYQYDSVGNLTVQDDAQHQRTCFYYDQLNRPTGKYYTSDTTACATINPPLVITYTYDQGSNGIGHRNRLDDASGYTTWTYDPRGRVTQEYKTIDGVVYSTAYTHDAMDRVLTIKYPTNELVYQTYNAASQLTSVAGTNNYASGMTYNALGQLKQVNLGNGASTTYAYYGDGGGAPAINSFRLWRINTTKPGTNLLDLQYTYDNVGNVRFINNPLAGENIEYEYDTLDRLVNAKAPLNESYEYNAIGNLMRKGNKAYTYPNSGSSSVRPHAATTAGGNSYQYDANGNMTQRIENNITYNQTWTKENRLATVSGNGQSATYTYDGDGNRIKKVQGGTTLYTVNALYEEEKSNVLQLTVQSNGTAGNGYTYRIFDATTTYVIQSGDQLEFDQYLDSANPQKFGGFDALLSSSGIVRSSGWVDQNGIGIHPGQNVAAYASGQWYHRVFNIGNKAGETLSTFKIAHEGDAAGTYVIRLDNVKITNGGVIKKVIYEDGALVSNAQAEGPTSEIASQTLTVSTATRPKSYYFASSQRVAMRQGSNLYYFVADHLGSTSVTLDASGNKIGEMKYYPFGETRPGYPTGSMPTDRRFTGQRAETGLGSLYDYNARFYSPALGRFLSADTIVPQADDPQAFNRYAYTSNNPLRYVDPSGHCKGEENDPNNPDIKCWDMRTQIQNTYTNIFIDPQNWTWQELDAVWKALYNHVFIKSIMTATRINLMRQTKAIGAEDPDAIGGQTFDFKNGTYNIIMYDHAWSMPPNMELQKPSYSLTNFQGQVIHEFTHVAIGQDPFIMKSYNLKTTSTIYNTAWALPRTFGHAYAYSEEYCRKKDCNEELVAMTASTYQLSPDTFNGLFLGFIPYTDWHKEWIQWLWQPNPYTPSGPAAFQAR